MFMLQKWLTGQVQPKSTPVDQPRMAWTPVYSFSIFNGAPNSSSQLTLIEGFLLFKACRIFLLHSAERNCGGWQVQLNFSRLAENGKNDDLFISTVDVARYFSITATL